MLFCVCVWGLYALFKCKYWVLYIQITLQRTETVTLTSRSYWPHYWSTKFFFFCAFFKNKTKIWKYVGQIKICWNWEGELGCFKSQEQVSTHVVWWQDWDVKCCRLWWLLWSAAIDGGPGEGGGGIRSLCQYITNCKRKKYYCSSITAARSSISKRTCNVAIIIAGFEGTCLWTYKHCQLLIDSNENDYHDNIQVTFSLLVPPLLKV